MKQQIWKPALIGIAVGALLYFMPFFFLRGFLFFFVIAAVFRLFWFRRRGYWWHHHAYHDYSHAYKQDPAFADVIRRMTPEEYEDFRKRNYNSGEGRSVTVD